MLFYDQLSQRYRVQCLTAMIWYEVDIIAISILRSTMTLITEYDPNMRSPQNRVNPLIPVNSKAFNSTSPKLAQNNDCDVSNKLKTIHFILKDIS
jgi:hypothetical protein